MKEKEDAKKKTATEAKETVEVAEKPAKTERKTTKSKK
jgi:hypothetical protein